MMETLPQWAQWIGSFVAGVIAVLAFVIFFWRAERMKQDEREHLLQQEISALRERFERQAEADREKIDTLSAALHRLEIEKARLEAQLERMRLFEEELEKSDAALDRERAHTLALEKEVSRLQAHMEEERTQTAMRLEELKEARETMRKEFETLATKILQEQGQRFGDASKARVEAVLAPLKEQMSAFRKRLEEIHTEETKSVASLRGEIGRLQDLNRQISEEATQLTKALKGENKKQGIWGEMVLERVLEASGLRKGEEYEREVSLRNDDTERFRPDVIVRLPGGRDVVIDAKTSLAAYEHYVNAETEEARASYAKAHLASVENHIRKLADKSYTRLDKINSLDFIFLFMPIEGALTLALQTDPGLFEKAFEQRIVLTGPTTLLVALRAVENTWRQERQSKNAQLIARQAGALYDKFVSFVEDLEKIGKQLETVQKSYERTWRKLADGRGNLLRQVQRLEELGARTSKRLPPHLKDEEATGDDTPDRPDKDS